MIQAVIHIYEIIKEYTLKNYPHKTGYLRGHQKGIDKGKKKNPKVSHLVGHSTVSTHTISVPLEPLTANITQEDGDLIMASKMLANEG